MKTRGILVGLMLPLTAANAATDDAGNSVSTDFAEGGVIVDMEVFFHGAANEGTVDQKQGIAGRALATSSGLYSFLETPENDEKLGDLPAGSVVHVTGKLLERGALLHIAELKRSGTISLDLDLAGLRADPGLQITLAGTNKCQCGLDVADLPHSCKLGHLHHLEAKDGNLYHYLPRSAGDRPVFGTGFSFQGCSRRRKVVSGELHQGRDGAAALAAREHNEGVGCKSRPQPQNGFLPRAANSRVPRRSK